MLLTEVGHRNPAGSRYQGRGASSKLICWLVFQVCHSSSAETHRFLQQKQPFLQLLLTYLENQLIITSWCTSALFVLTYLWYFVTKITHFPPLLFFLNLRKSCLCCWDVKTGRLRQTGGKQKPGLRKTNVRLSDVWPWEKSLRSLSEEGNGDTFTYGLVDLIIRESRLAWYPINPSERWLHFLSTLPSLDPLLLAVFLIFHRVTVRQMSPEGRSKQPSLLHFIMPPCPPSLASVWIWWLAVTVH